MKKIEEKAELFFQQLQMLIASIFWKKQLTTSNINLAMTVDDFIKYAPSNQELDVECSDGWVTVFKENEDFAQVIGRKTSFTLNT